MPIGLDIGIPGLSRVKLKKTKILYFLGLGSYFLSHRMPTALAAIDLGYEVHVVAIDDGIAEELKNTGVIFHVRSMQNNTSTVVASVLGLLQLLIILIRVRPSILHFIGLKSSPIGLVSALFLWRNRVLFSINGLGYLFSNPEISSFHKLLRQLIMLGFTVVTSIRPVEIIFQNDDDKAVFKTACSVNKASFHTVRGSGVDTAYFQLEPLPSSKPKFLFGMACRMVEIKGVLELIAAVTQLQNEGLPIKLLLAGDVDHGNPGSLSEKYLTALCEQEGIEWRGYVHNIRGFWSECHVAVLPSHGGEGVPMALLMAAAMGRPLIASDTNGNRDLVIDGENGYLCKPRNVDSLKTAIRACLSSDLTKLGRESNRIIKDRGMDSQAVRQEFRLIYEQGD